MGTRSSFLWTKPSLLVLPPPSICHDRYVSATAFSHSGSAHQTRRQEYEKRRKKAALKRMYQRDSMGTPHCRPPLPIAARKHHSRSAQAFSIITHSVRIERLGSGWD